MGRDTTFTEYHLTQRGWMEGAWAVDKPPENLHPPPENRIETWRVNETSHDTYPQKPIPEWERIWVSAGWPEEDKLFQLRTQISDKLATEAQRTGQFSSYYPYKVP